MKKYSLSDEQIALLKTQAITARGAILKATTLASSGHPGGSMSTIDILLSLYNSSNIFPDNLDREDRDRIVISNGHISPCVYSALALNGFFPLDDFVSQFRLCGSIYEGHVERSVPGIEWGTGNLGQGLSAAAGFALAGKLKQYHNQIYVIMGDGEQQKGQLSEARRFAIKYGLHNITGIIDYNRLQISGNINSVMPQRIKENYLSDGWQVLEIDGHDFLEIESALDTAKDIDAPVLILAHTIMGKGVSFMENKEKYHGAALNEEQLGEALEELSLHNDLPYFRDLRNRFVPNHIKAPEASHRFNFKTGTPILYEKPSDNRSAWGNAIADLAKENKSTGFTPIVVFDCDLQGSVKTKEFAEVLPDNFIQCGIMEHHTATMAGSISLESIQPFFADFGVFGIDETYNQHRLNDINETNLKLIVTHIGLDVGEDGKTHQCLDYLGLMRNLYHFKVIVPVCPNQTDRIIREVVNKEGNYLIAMGRSKLPVITKEDGTPFYDQSYKYEYGKADLIIDGDDGAFFTMGSVAGKAMEIVKKLKARGIHLQLWMTSSPLVCDQESLVKLTKTGTIFTYEDHNVNTGLGCCIANHLVEKQLSARLYKFGVTDYAVSGSADDVYRYAGLGIETIVEKIANIICE